MLSGKALDVDKKQAKSESYDYSIAFMKAFLSFCVICCHYFSTSLGGYPIAAFGRIKSVAVLIFFIISFFLTKDIFADSNNTERINKRMWRLVFPYICWSVIYYLIYKLIDLLLICFAWNDGLRIDLSYKDLIWQIVFGSSEKLCPPLWFQFDIIVITLLIWIIYKYAPKYVWRILILGLIITYGLQYSGLNYAMFGWLGYEMRYSLGRLVEVFPAVCIGLAFAYSSLLEFFREHRIYTMIICALSMVEISYLGLLTTPEKDFYYSGIYKTIYAVLAFIFFYVFPFGILPNSIKKILKFLSKYSFGVFCIHFGVGFLWNAILCRCFGLRENTFIQCLSIYFISIFLSWAISRVPLKYLKYLVQ